MKLTLKTIYGRTLAYPADETAHKFADLLRVKTLTRSQLEQIEALGFTLETAGGPSLEDVA
jgi:hypothetical protein